MSQLWPQDVLQNKVILFVTDSSSWYYLFNNHHILQLRPETVAVRRRMNMMSDDDGQMIPRDDCSPSLTFALQLMKNPGITSTNRGSRREMVWLVGREWACIAVEREYVGIMQCSFSLVTVVVIATARGENGCTDIISRHCEIPVWSDDDAGNPLNQCARR